MAAQRYKPLVSPTATRLLSLSGTGGAGLIQRELQDVDLDQSHVPTYCVLSYVWNVLNPEYLWGNAIREVLCCGEKVSVTPNLQAALEKIWKKWPVALLWVHAMCIDQEDDDEKSQQVARMGQIFSQATRVLVWLGVEALWPPEYLWPESLSPRNTSSRPSRSITKLSFDTVMGALQDPVGECLAPWDKFNEAVGLLQQDYWWTASLRKKLKTIEHCAQIVRSDRGVLRNLLVAARHRSATDLRDKIYSLMNLVDRQKYAGIHKNYKADVAHMFAKATVTMMTVDRDLSILSSAGLENPTGGQE